MNDPTLYLVRVWQHAGGARAAVRPADHGEPRLFTAAQPLGDFLLGAAAAPRGAAAAAAANGHAATVAAPVRSAP
jgi:hypothetical protein